MSSDKTIAAERQLPAGQEMFLDHVGHFVRDPDAASRALERAGFAPTPTSVQVASGAASDKPELTGIGNVTAMFTRGYIEVLFTTADTPLAREFDAALSAYSGIHLAAFSVADAAAAHARLAGAGFRVRPLAHLRRPVATESGNGVAAFTVARVERGEMAEGRIQILTHHTEDHVWQKRWLDHPNGALALVDLIVVVDDLAGAAARFARFTGRRAEPTPAGGAIRLDRGALQLVTSPAWRVMAPAVAIPKLPCLAGYAITVRALAQARAALERAGIPTYQTGGALAAAFPPELGVGAWFLAEHAAALPWRG